MNRLRAAKNKADDNNADPALARVDAAAALPLAGGMSRSPTYDQLEEEHSPAIVLLRRGGNGVAERVARPADTAATDVTYFIGNGEGELTPPGGPSIREDSMMSYYAVDHHYQQ